MPGGFAAMNRFVKSNIAEAAVPAGGGVFVWFLGGFL